ncbi:MAG: transcription termination/antitermination protein NusG [Bythopirellula sp.]|nr:transcription termination/antitermination protein NusG [Bythopirellula sp.]
MSDEAEKIIDDSTAEEESRLAGDTATATEDESQEEQSAIDQAEAALAEEEVNDQTDEGAADETAAADEAEVVRVKEPAVMKKSAATKKKEKLDELDPIKRALLPKVKDDGPVVMDWYILKVQSNRERSIADALKRKIAIEGLDRYFDDVIVPTEKVTEFKAGKKKVVERKLYPGYIVVHMCINDDTWFAVRETSGIGDFTGSAGKPTPMLAHEVARIIKKDEEEVSDSPKLNINFKIGDRVKIKEGTFESFEGEVHLIDQQNGRISVMINIFGRSTPVELEYWQVEVL